jgi:hypothetical protein
MAKKPTAPKAETSVAVSSVAVSTAPAPKFVACRQCSYPADCERRAKCHKGFK